MSKHGPSRRWDVFSQALALAGRSSATGWNYEEFVEGFPSWAKAEKEHSVTFHRQIQDYIAGETRNQIETIFEQYRVQENITVMHRAILDAERRKREGTTRKDAWKDGRAPQDIAAASTIPILQAEKNRLNAILNKLEEENDVLGQELEKEIALEDKMVARTTKILDGLDAAVKEWEVLPLDDLYAWSETAAEGTVR
ncbi:hypothetical protein CYLTODRAFT_404200 [Cylindrobasidium torrendii FP15055 ss-10]|uniref:Nnf1-domain-containing protein n=1 Tax=Cylindrobasidium torrendii FP15055 ss-10 TaxID=1314674 RepID=A0A0D7AZN6_9AGAR|nr:hypothetical protein CYLTODRAFT_404200 [Cylindrobasidium torrendii FP15055 ss-10]